MTPTTYQKPEIRDANDNIIQQGAFGKNTALANATNDGWIDYVANDLEFLYDLAKDEVVPVPSLPASGQMNKTYLLTTTGVSYRWSGTEWVAVSSSEAVGRAESAALLAEQWATKTDGSVDGTEYSAKYYAQQADASADDAQDVADDMADHLVQIDKNTGGVSKNSKRISNIEKLLQGNLYDYDTDDDSAYTKTVPSGALPYAGIEQIGGKTLVWNQLAQLISDSGVSQGITWTKNDNGTYSAVGTSTGSTYRDTTHRLTSLAGHKILIKGCPANDGTNKYMIFDGYSNGATSGDYGYGKIYTAGANVQIRCFIASDATVDIVFTPQVFDLTLMFGAGNEPTTVAEFEAMFPADYYAYNAGTLLSAGVTEVESVGVNMMPPAPAGTQIVNGITATSDGAGTYKISGTATASTYIYFDIPTFATPISAGRGGEYVFALNNSANSNAVNFRFYNGTTQVDSWGTTPANRYIYSYNALADKTVNRVGIAVTNGETVDMEISPAFVPYKADYPTTSTSYHVFYKYVAEISMPIPAEVRALEGYGWSAGSVYNYIDYERKVFVQNVGRVVVTEDTSIIRENSDVDNFSRYYFSYDQMKRLYIADTKTYRDLMVSDFGTVRNNFTSTGNDVGVTGYKSNTNVGKNWVYIFATQTTVEEFKTYLASNPITIYYELATPIETDISQYLTDNLIEVGAGGTLTFPNANGDDYHIPVPSTETYMIDLQSAIGE